MKLGSYVYSKDRTYTTEDIEKRSLQFLNKGVKYDGEWIVGTNIR